jgi:hypothetical protein
MTLSLRVNGGLFASDAKAIVTHTQAGYGQEMPKGMSVNIARLVRNQPPSSSEGFRTGVERTATVLPHPARDSTLGIPNLARRAVSQDQQHPADSSPTTGRTLLIRLIVIGVIVIGSIVGVIWYLNS